LPVDVELAVACNGAAVVLKSLARAEYRVVHPSSDGKASAPRPRARQDLPVFFIQKFQHYEFVDFRYV